MWGDTGEVAAAAEVAVVQEVLEEAEVREEEQAVRHFWVAIIVLIMTEEEGIILTIQPTEILELSEDGLLKE